MALLWEDYLAMKNCPMGETIRLTTGTEYTQRSNGLPPVGELSGGRGTNITDTSGWFGYDSAFDRAIREIEDGDY